MLCLCHYGPALLRFWFQTDLGRENSASDLKIQAEKTFSYHCHALVQLTLYNKGGVGGKIGYIAWEEFVFHA